MWAIYCLITFYYATREELSPFNPVLKFVIVKAVVFFCFWQGMILGVIAYMGYIPDTADNIVEAIQEVSISALTCVKRPSPHRYGYLTVPDALHRAFLYMHTHDICIHITHTNTHDRRFSCA